MVRYRFGLLLLLWAGIGCRPESDPAGTKQTSAASCDESFDPSRNYFPDHVNIRHATGFSVRYANAYKVVTIQKPWRDAGKTFTYVLKACGAPDPDMQADAVITVPVKRIATTSTTQLPGFIQLERMSAWVAHAGLSYVTLPELRAVIEKGGVRELGSGEVNQEALLAVRPDLVMTYVLGGNQAQWTKLQELGLKTVLNAEYVEDDPLARAEWLKFMALFLNEEAKAEHVFEAIESAYETLKASLRNVPDQPSVFSGSAFEGQWYIAGKSNYLAHFLEDAGGRYAFSGTDQTLMPSFERVLLEGAPADVWIGTVAYPNRAAVEQSDTRLLNFKSIQNGRYFWYDGHFFEGAVAEPHIVLQDLAAILHPSVYPNHRLKYFQRMETR